MQLRLRLHGIDLSPLVCACRQRRKSTLPPFPPVLAATPPLPWFRLTLFLASSRLLDLSLLRDTCASQRRCAQYCRAIANARQCTVVATFVCDMRSRINMKSRLKFVFFKCGLRTHRIYSCLLYKSLRVNFIVSIQNKFGRFSYIVLIILYHIRRFNIFILEFLYLILSNICYVNIWK